ncbi:NUDIX hydrolase [Falsibacillus pallidus]|uniref:Isopentenyldiphosphate isomerase n=1 Tax=Falsibacillus pallidus TaxID=493781 RepID=A0A370GQ21_9BACI|nr:NUDIX domain-containing protein [Falsibacillus pallidus]RDI45489.1 isopentenyldiphosphate isomerase [Falsibacillus pallidus]
MESELIKIVDENGTELGVATREEIHRLGHWHETFHCWFVTRENQVDYIHLQLRSEDKKDYPNLLDITAAGHLLAEETVEDGLREVKEEVGLELALSELIHLGVISYEVEREDLIDRERTHTYLFLHEGPINNYELQKEEVAGIVKIEFQEFSELWAGTREKVCIEGFGETKEGEFFQITDSVGKEAFVPHEEDFYQEIIKKISFHLERTKQ